MKCDLVEMGRPCKIHAGGALADPGRTLHGVRECVRCGREVCAADTNVYECPKRQKEKTK